MLDQAGRSTQIRDKNWLTQAQREKEGKKPLLAKLVRKIARSWYMTESRDNHPGQRNPRKGPIRKSTGHFLI